jgi:hypothetical protein
VAKTLARLVLLEFTGSFSQGVMETKTEFVQLVSAVIGLSVGVGVMTATVLLGVAALFQ